MNVAGRLETSAILAKTNEPATQPEYARSQTIGDVVDFGINEAKDKREPDAGRKGAEKAGPRGATPDSKGNPSQNQANQGPVLGGNGSPTSPDPDGEPVPATEPVKVEPFPTGAQEMQGWSPDEAEKAALETHLRQYDSLNPAWRMFKYMLAATPEKPYDVEAIAGAMPEQQQADDELRGPQSGLSRQQADCANVNERSKTDLLALPPRAPDR